METLEQIEQRDKSHYLEDRVLLGTPAEVTQAMQELGEIN